MCYGQFSLTVCGQNLHKLTRDKQLHKLSQGDYKAHSESQHSASLSVDFLRVVKCHSFSGIYPMVTLCFMQYCRGPVPVKMLKAAHETETANYDSRTL